MIPLIRRNVPPSAELLGTMTPSCQTHTRDHPSFQTRLTPLPPSFVNTDIVMWRTPSELCLFRGRRMGDILRMAFTQNRVRSYTGVSLSLTVCLLSYGPLLLSA